MRARTPEAAARATPRTRRPPAPPRRPRRSSRRLPAARPRASKGGGRSPAVRPAAVAMASASFNNCFCFACVEQSALGVVTQFGQFKRFAEVRAQRGGGGVRAGPARGAWGRVRARANATARVGAESSRAFYFVHRSASFCCNDVRCVPLPCGRRASARRVRGREIMRVRVRGRAHARSACQPFASRSGTGKAPLRVRPFGHQVHAWRLPKMSRGACGPANLSPRARAAPREQCASRAGRARAPRRRVCVREECISTARCVID